MFREPLGDRPLERVSGGPVKHSLWTLGGLSHESDLLPSALPPWILFGYETDELYMTHHNSGVVAHLWLPWDGRFGCVEQFYVFCDYPSLKPLPSDQIPPEVFFTLLENPIDTNPV